MSPSPIVYRKAVEMDAPELVGVHYAAVQALASDHYAADVVAAWSPPPDEARYRWLASLISQDDVLCIVASLLDGQVAGFCIVAPDESQLKAIYVHPAFAGWGVGRGLLERAEAHCRDRGAEVLWLNASYNAEAFYASCGYKIVGPVIQPISEETSMGATRMVKSLVMAT